MRLIPAIHDTTSALAILWAVMLIGISARNAEAQERKPLHRIRIFQEDDVCFYQIQGQTNQDTFRITPLGAVIFRTNGVKAQVEVDDAQVGDETIPGMAAEKSAEISEGRPVQSLAVRTARGMNTDHKVNIRCCTSRNLFGCRWLEAQPAPPPKSMGAASGFLPGVNPSFGGGPRAMSRAIPLPSRGERIGLPPGGPIMKIEED